MTTPKAFADLLAPVTEEEFFRDYYGERHLRLEGHPEKLAGLFGWDELNDVLASHRLCETRLRVARHGKIAPEASVLDFARRASPRHRPRVDPTGLNALLRDGAQIILDDVHELTPTLRRLGESLDAAFGEKVLVTAFVGFGGDTYAFPNHRDDHDVFVMQLHGRKHWKVFAPTRKYPVEDDVEIGEEPTEPLWAGHLEAGDVLYLPRGFWHEVTSVGPTIHLTFSVKSRTCIDFVKWVAGELCRSEAFRKNLPRDPRDPAAESTLRRLLADLPSLFSQQGLQAFWDRRNAGAHGEPAVNFPWSVTGVMPPDGMRLRFALSRYAINETDGGFRVASRGREWELDAGAGALVSALRDGATPTVGAARAGRPHDIEQGAWDDLLRELIATGFVWVEA